MKKQKTRKAISYAGFVMNTGGDEKIRTSDTLLGYAPLAGECLRPLGHVSEPVCLWQNRRLNSNGSAPSGQTTLRLFRLIQTKSPVQDAYGQFQILFVDDHGDLDFRSRDHLQVDALFCQSTEHLAGNARM